MKDGNDSEKSMVIEEYGKMIQEITPKANLWKRCFRAFWVGGLICVAGQGIIYVAQNWFGLNPEDASAWCTVLLILISVILTNFGIYRNVVSFGGAGALVPITGFANSVSSAATEFKYEGWVFGVGSKIFSIAGPVILYGLVTSWLLGLVYWIMKLMGLA